LFYHSPITNYLILRKDRITMLMILIKILHIAVAVFLILVVLLQTGKGAEMGAAFGGSSQTLFGGGGPAGFMAKLTTAAAVGFMLTSLGLAYVSSAGRLGDVQLPAGQEMPAQLPVETAPDASQVPEGGTAVPPSSGEETPSQ
jgi:preprotein translocase subunit SecG